MNFGLCSVFLFYFFVVLVFFVEEVVMRIRVEVKWVLVERRCLWLVYIGFVGEI